MQIRIRVCVLQVLWGVEIGTAFPNWETAIFRALNGVVLRREIGGKERRMLGEKAAEVCALRV
jgi:hypothetical protein